MENSINLNLGSVPSIIRNYKYTYGQKNEMKHMVEVVTRKYTVQVVVDHTEHQQVVLQILKMPKNMMK